MAPLALTVAKNRQIVYLLGVRKKIASLKEICGDPEKQGRLSTTTARLAEAWRKYDSTQQDVVSLVAEDNVVYEQVIFNKMEENYEAAMDEANEIIKVELSDEGGRDPRL